MKIIKFNLLGDFAFFKNKVNLRENSSYLSIHKPATLGLLGAILGIDGFSDFEKNGYIKYIEELSDIDIGIKINNKIDFISVKTNDSTSLDITNVKNRVTQQIENVLTNVDYDIFLKIEDKNLYDKILNALEHKSFVFDPNLGKSYFPGSILNVVEYDIQDKLQFNKQMDSESEAFYIKSIFPTEFLTDTTDYGVEEEFYEEIGLRYRLPVKSDSKTGIYIENQEFTYKNFTDKNDVFSSDKFLVINDEIIYFI